MSSSVDGALLAWCWYHHRTESFDRTLPGYWSPYDADSWLPYEWVRSHSQRRARNCRTVLARIGHIDDQNAKSTSLHMTFDQWGQLLNSAPELTASLDDALIRIEQ